jgi:type II secretory pathway component PulM
MARREPPVSRTWTEQRTIAWGVAIVLLALVVRFGVVPTAARWRAREAEIGAARARVAQLRGFEAGTSQLEQAAGARERVLATRARRVMHARTLPLAGSALQALLQEAADGAGLVVNRVDVDSEADSSGAVTASMSVVGDVAGLTTLLETMSHGARVVEVQRLTVQQTSALRGAADVLQVTIGVRAPVILE